ncbi:type ISP restriction/modification enzyme [Mesorhizobium sp. AA22]|uniref:type ISP restriction/modification enzyme n=1 Tax=Mesorhizobium sp. AA22 TaxID=1854057 RepID=UPI0007ED586E|nr:type ISP restriction/modification enzyme [Mesorhizobium sp. AA22]QIA23286.1 N-6 DNA methylase [Mesorhizobium sp. AA22]
MSQLLIQQYLNEIDRLRKFSGSITEGVISEAFKDLLKAWSRQLNWQFAAQYEFPSTQKSRIRPDGTIFHSLGLPFGYWEAKDTADDLDVEIGKKLSKGYPQDNIIFENSHTAVLIQNREEVLRCPMTNTEALLKLLNLFFKYEREEIREFRKAVEQFKTYLPFVLKALRERIDTAYEANAAFRVAADKFLQHARDTINPSVGEADVREMLIQHILTEEIFANVFNDSDFHRENNIAKELYALEGKFFTGAVKKDTLKGLELYYAAIRANAAEISSHVEKQKFLKLIYENFYKVYNPKAADRLGVVYTPNEIVKFMIEGADWLTQKHFSRQLIDEHVEILDPATGTGTFICELLEHFRGQPQKLAHKYKNELHANEVAILPYYVANLNIEATYAAISGQFAEFPNLCFVDTLDNVAGLGIKAGYQHDMFAGLSDENVARVRRQNNRKISVIIGNPPYNANQANENDNNKNRDYPRIDQLIKSSYIRLSTAQKTKVYDMYARFFRWASDRMADDGVLAFITNRSFIESRTFDGFRKAVAQEFNEIYVVDLGGDVRANPKLSGTKHNVFGIQTGVAISFMVKRHKQKGCKIFYARRPEFDTALDKLAYLGNTEASAISYQRIEPDKNGNWVNLTENDWDEMIPVADKKTKAAKAKSQEKAIFRLFSFGLVTNRDDWMYDRSDEKLGIKASYLVDRYESDRKTLPRYRQGKPQVDKLDSSIKWTRSVKRSLQNDRPFRLSDTRTVAAMYRPFDRQKLLFYPPLIEMLNQTRAIYGEHGEALNPTAVFADPTSQKPFMVTASECLIDMHLVGAAAGATALPRYRYSKVGERVDNITDWALKEFQKIYGKDGRAAPISTAREEIGQSRKAAPALTKDDIFHYVYGVLHDPVYREKYALNLKREIPRVPFYPDFWAWAGWGERLLELHIGYETVEPWPLDRLDAPDEKARAAGVSPKAMLKADRDSGTIRLDTETQLCGIPPEAWEYRLGNRSGLDWILDQYKEKTPKDPTIREKFNTYRFADYKEKVLDLLARVARVSVETVAITEAMKLAKR